MFSKSVWTLLKETGTEWSDDKASRLGAALAYYTVFSLAPLLIIAIAVAGLVFGQSAAEGHVSEELRGVVGDHVAGAVEQMIIGAQRPVSGTVATFVSAVTLLLAATGVIVQLKDALNTIWGVTAKPGRSLRTFVKDYIISVAALLGVGFLLIVSLLLSTALAVMGKYLGDIRPVPEALFHLVNAALSFGVMSLMFALMFKFLPDIKIAWRSVWLGAVGTSLLFTIGKTAISIYLGRQAFDSTYGAASSFAAILAWAYYLSQVLFFGAEFTKVYARYRGERVEPTAAAISLRPGSPAR